MNHHRPREKIFINKFLHLSYYRVPVSSKLVSLVIKYQNAFSSTSKCFCDSDDITHIFFLFLYTNCSLIFLFFFPLPQYGPTETHTHHGWCAGGDLFVGPKAEDHRGLLSIRYPMEHGIVNDWNDMERIWTHIYTTNRHSFQDELSTFSEEHPVLLTEAPLNPRKNREKAAEIFFETFNVPALFVSMQTVSSDELMDQQISQQDQFKIKKTKNSYLNLLLFYFIHEKFNMILH